ncbi:MAG: undecaprenyl/decaprenyl-phosphate alpha-N-acetylglucosaminyl 1-phosphate transferase [Candidatus Omnitrophica bacterium]|nr:undecaprenyl/decaprenyl-phosphate alpha-N-acetylglucosaminyl 1-phosphate transferase [Candidatus Omnitrophota bacterium]
MVIVSIFSLLFSFTFTLIFTPHILNLALKIAPFKKGKVDIKEGKRISHLGGVGIFISFLIVVLLMSLHKDFFTSQAKGIILGTTIIFLVGILDDFIELSPATKFLGQIIATFALVVFGATTKMVIAGPVGNIFITFIWMLVIINALNLLDIMDGLCSGITVIAAGAFLVVSFISNNLVTSILCSFIIGAGLGFLRYNFPPARIYLGDNGSMVFGFLLAATAIMIDYAPLKRQIALLTPILVLGLPLFDTAFVILMRILHGRAVMKKSKDHFALRLLTAGWKEPKTLLLMYLFALFFGASAILINRVSNLQGGVILVIIVSICGLALKKIGAIKIDG